MIEVPLYMCLSVIMIGNFGIAGAASAWFARAVVEALFMFGLAHRFVPGAGGAIGRTFIAVAAALFMIGGVVMVQSLVIRLAVFGVGTIVFLALAWIGLFNRQERDALRKLLGSATPAA